MRRLPLALLALAMPAFAQPATVDGGAADPAAAPIAPTPTDTGASEAQPAPGDGGVAEPSADLIASTPADGGVPSPPDAGASEPQPERVGRHFAFLWDSTGPEPFVADIQLWATPRFGRPDGQFAVDLRGGFVQGLPRDWAWGVFLDATPSSSGTAGAPAVDGRFTLRLQNRSTLGAHLSYGSQLEVGAGVRGMAVSLLLAADTQLGLLRVGLNLDGQTETTWSKGSAAAFGTSRVQQTLGLSYTLPIGLSAGIEVQNRLSWVNGAFVGDVLLIGPSVAYRGTRFFWTLALLPQVAALKSAPQHDPMEPLELTANERFTARLTVGIVTR